MGEERLAALLQESLAVATRPEAMKPKDLARVVVDTTVQPKAVMLPTDAKLLNRAREQLPCWRRHQRRARRRRLQLPSPDQMAGALAVQLLGCPETTAHPSMGLKIEKTSRATLHGRRIMSWCSAASATCGGEVLEIRVVDPALADAFVG